MTTQQKAAGRTAASPESAFVTTRLHFTQHLNTELLKQLIRHYFLIGKHLTVLCMRQILGFLRPARLIQLLREEVWNTVTHYTVEIDVRAGKHRQGTYVLFHNNNAA